MESEAVRSGAVTVTAGHVGGINGRLPGAVIVTDAVFVPTVSYVCGIEDAPVPDTVPPHVYVEPDGAPDTLHCTDVCFIK